MTIIGASLLLLVSCILLWISSDKTVEYAQQLAESFNVGGMFLGFIGVAFFTGLPEIFVALESLMLNQPLLSAGNIFGSQLVVLTIALGFPIMIHGPLIMSPANKTKSLMMLCFNLISLLFVYLMGTVSRSGGLFLISVYIVGALALYRFGVYFKTADSTQTTYEPPVEIKRIRAVMKCLASIFLLVIASRLCVESGIAIAQLTQLPVWLMGSLFVSLATSAPELLVNVQALRKKRYSLALGNSLGSAFQSGALVMGLLATFGKQPIDISYFFHLIPCFVAVYATFLIFTLLNRPVPKIVGGLLLLLYCICMVLELFASVG